MSEDHLQQIRRGFAESASLSDEPPRLGPLRALAVREELAADPCVSRPLRASGPGCFERRDLLPDASLASQQQVPPLVDRHQPRSPDPRGGLGGVAEC
jgi:hypothetical protein